MRRISLPAALVTLLVFVAGAAPFASAAVVNRISHAVSDDTRTAIADSVNPKVKGSTDLGAAPLDQKLEAMTLRFSMTLAQSAALDQLLVDQQNPNSPQYHQWLTPAQYAAQFGLSASDIAKVTAWLTTEGFTVTGVANSATFVTFSGTVAQVQRAFATSIHTLSLNGETHYANVTPVALPSAISGVVMGVTGLHDFKLKPHVHQTGTTPVAKPSFTYTTGGVTSHYIAPGDFYTIYDESPLFAATTPINGSGVTIAVMGQVNVNLADIASYRTMFGLTANVPTIKVVGTAPPATNNCSPATSSNCPSPNNDDLGESDLDLEWSGTAAPSASILFVTSSDVIDGSLTQAIDNNLAPIMTVSYGNCESGLGTVAQLNVYNQLFKQANAQGITIVASSGDTGATTCDSYPLATGGLTVDFPASSPYVTGVGGTMFNEGVGSYWASSNGTYSGSALSYIPEAVWNESTTSTSQQLSAGGGGSSQMFAKPAWQTGLGVPNDYARDVPDVSLAAAANHDGYLYCTLSACSGGQINVAGGTSFAAPNFAGMLALVEQKTGSRIGNANPTIYALAANYYATVFHDITTGNNSSPCESGTPNCPNGGSIGYSATTGYDLATGWGTIDAANLVNDWKLVTALGSGSLGSNVSVTTVTSSPVASATAGATVTVTATIASGTSGFTTTPTGTVNFLVDNVAVGSAVTLSGNTATYSWTTTSATTSGAHVITASYSGDTNYAGSLGTVDVDIVSTTTADFTLTPASSVITVASGASGSQVFTVTSSSTATPFAGTISFSVSTSSNTLQTYGAAGFAPATVTLSTTAASGTTTLTLYSNSSGALHGGGTIAAFKLASNSSPQGSPAGRSPWYAASSGIAIASMVMLLLPRRRRWSAMLVLALSVAMAGGAIGCSSNSSSATSSSSTTTPAGSYPVTVTATGTTSTGAVVNHTVNVTFVVQ